MIKQSIDTLLGILKDKKKQIDRALIYKKYNNLRQLTKITKRILDDIDYDGKLTAEMFTARSMQFNPE